MKYRNPIIPGFYPDPSICRVGDDYYLANSTFEYFPGVPVFHSKDLINWRQIGHCLTRRSQLDLGDRYGPHGIYAPTLRYNNGRFYMITTDVGGKGHFFVHTDDPAGEWSDPVHIEGSGFDPDLFFDDDGKVYCSYHPSRGTIRQRQIDLATGKLIGDEICIWEGFEDKLCEAPHIYKINGMYYLLTAEGETHHGHMATISRSSSPNGPFESCPHNPILTHRSLGYLHIQSIGHADLVQAHDGSWWIVFLGVRRIGWGNQHLGRETFLAPVAWTEDGWPVVNGGKPIMPEMEADCLPQHPWPKEPARDDFDSEKLRLCWNFRRNPWENQWSLDERPGWLTLKGNSASLSDIHHHAFIGRRQTHFQCTATALLDFKPAMDNEEAGITVIMNENFHYEIAVTRLNGLRSIIVRKRAGDMTVVQSEPIGDGDVTLQIKAERFKYTFSFSIDGCPLKEVASGETRLISQEVAGGFTGVYMGMYASGNGNPSPAPAYFDWFEYVPGEE